MPETLLDQIINESVDSSKDLADLLRKCKILANRLNNDSFSSWVDAELNGYPKEVDTPEYRQLTITNRGTLKGFEGTIENAALAMFNIQKQLKVLDLDNFNKEFFEIFHFREGVKSISELAIREEVTQKSPWEATLTGLFSEVGLFYKNYSLVEAWRLLSTPQITGILDSIRNKILEFALQIQKENPDAGERVGSTPMEPDKVQKIYTDCIIASDGGNIGNAASNSENFTQNQTTNNVIKGDIESLKIHMKELGLEDDDISELEKAIAAEPNFQPSAEQKHSKPVANWLGTIYSKAAQGILSNKITDLVEQGLEMFGG